MDHGSYHSHLRSLVYEVSSCIGISLRTLDEIDTDKSFQVYET
jgi:hypothetical protein